MQEIVSEAVLIGEPYAVDPTSVAADILARTEIVLGTQEQARRWIPEYIGSAI